MPNLMKALTVGSGTYEVCDAASREALENKVDKVDGKGLSTYDYDVAAKQKVDAIPENPKYTDTLYDDTAVVEGLSQLKDDKLDKPVTAPEVGKILKVASVNEDGTFACEWSNEKTSGEGGGLDYLSVVGGAVNIVFEVEN